MVARHAAVLAVSLVAATAHADDGDPDLEHDLAAAGYATTPAPVAHHAIDYEQRVRMQGEIDLRVGPASVDGTHVGTVAGAAGALGAHLGRFTLLGDYAISPISYPSMPAVDVAAHGQPLPIAGSDGLLYHRLGVTGRYSFAKAESAPGSLAEDMQMLGELWLEGGVGEEIIQWDRGGTFERPDLALGIGMQGMLRTSADRRGGVFFAFRVHFARRTDLDGLGPTCSAVCTQATPPSQWSDRSYMFETGFVFGN